VTCRGAWLRAPTESRSGGSVRPPCIPSFLLVLGLWGSALAVPVDGPYTDDPRCDTVPDAPVVHEIGEAVSPVDEPIFADALPTDTLLPTRSGSTAPSR